MIAAQVVALSAKNRLEGAWSCGVAAAADDRRARSRYANIARQKGKRTAKEQKKENKNKDKEILWRRPQRDSRHRQSFDRTWYTYIDFFEKDFIMKQLIVIN